MTKFNIPAKPKRKQMHRVIIIPPGTELYPFVFDPQGKERAYEETLSILLYATDSVIQTAIAKGFINKNPVEIFEAAHAKEVLQNFIYNNKKESSHD